MVVQVRASQLGVHWLSHSLLHSHSPFSLPLSLHYPLASLCLSLPLFLYLSLPSTERTRLGGELRFARGHYHSLLSAHGLGAHGFSIERARLARGTSLRSWFQIEASYLWEFHFFFPKIPPILKLEVGFLST